MSEMFVSGVDLGDSSSPSSKLGAVVEKIAENEDTDVGGSNDATEKAIKE